MIAELGTFILGLALLASFVQAAASLFGVARHQSDIIDTGNYAARAGFALIALAFVCLVALHLMDDFSVTNVVANSAHAKPILYKITGAWASHEGSMLLWVLILSICGALLSWAQRTMPKDLRARAVGVMGAMGSGFLSFILLTSNPFARLASAPADGNGLNPLLQDPGLAFHPPCLYAGYVGFASAFALAAAILMGSNARREIIFLRPWILGSWAFLSFGIAMGSWWAYYELGWGGFWFWDPVENAALLPWLAATALVHSLMVSIKRGSLISWTLLLAILTFSLSLLGTFLVRSGVLTSVHSFAVDPARGVFVLGLLAAYVGGALTLYALRAPHLPQSAAFSPVSREGAMLINNLFLTCACATLLIGTLYPLLLQALGGEAISVGAPYFNATILPLMMPVAALMVVGPFLRWRLGDFGAAYRALGIVVALCVLACIAEFYAAGWHGALGSIALILGLWVTFGSLADARLQRTQLFLQGPRLLAHFGFGVTLLGLAGSALSTQSIVLLHPHEVTEVNGYRLELAGIDALDGPNYEALRATVHVNKGALGLTLSPEIRYYPLQQTSISNVAIHTNLMRDLYLALAATPDQDMHNPVYTLRFHDNILAPWIWIGGGIMAIGALLGVAQHLRRRT